jgi:HK97 family phage portal protein
MARMREALARLMPWRAQGPAHVEAKASKAHRLVAIEQLGQPVWAPRDYAAFAREGFMQNAIVYRSVRMIAEAAATIPLLLYEGNRELDTHPLLDLVAHPSLDHTSVDFFESWYGYLLVSGNAYVEAVGIDGQLRELHALRPDRMRVIPGADGWPEGYDYTAGGRSIRLAGDVVDGVRNVLHVRLFHPANDYYGMSPIEAAASAIDIHNQASKWNKALLDNSARPSGALVYASREGQLTDEQFQRLKEELEAGFQGTRGAGRPMLLEGGLDWRPLSLSPKDMDFVEAKNCAAREIALALGVPPMLLGIPGDNTYSNYQEASRSLWRQTVLPLVVRTAKAMSNWLGPAWGGGLELRPDLDAIEALSSERDQLWTRLEKASFLDRDEKRWAAGYGTSPGDGRGGGLAAKYNPDQPRVPAGNSDGGQWTGGGAGAVLSDATPDNYWLPGSQLAQVDGDDRYRVDLLEEEGRGGHTYKQHVAKSELSLQERVRQSIAADPDPERHHIRSGSFTSMAAAQRLVNATLSSPTNRATVDSVANGIVREVRVDETFSSLTGYEAYASTIRSQPVIRDTYSVGVYIRHDPISPRGYAVISAYPRNRD